ncbi:PilZ domain-containing protein [Pelagibacterium sp. H642]|uniref:PilZ domain-containing protein n=1 Tax=Pelagibacterium sp. H642 TaxID=1881069 RepID=UPI002814D02A|nr:PilZ domain-containing protein [Pelagibacterium sp. H642]WMT89146.1 PilZ domain-containing protein [Pelagibacterium sp. H642]
MDKRDDVSPGTASLDDRTRVLVNMRGRYHLEKWQHAPDRKVSLFACRIQRLSPATILMNAPVSGEIGDWVVAQFNELGRLRGQIQRRLGFGFVMSLDLDEQARRKMLEKIVWFEKFQNFAVSDTRRHTRIVPTNPQSTLVLPDASLVSCFVIDISSSGAAVSADIEVKIGMPLALGTVVGRVVRQLDPGFAIQFIETIPSADLERRLIRSIDQLAPDLRKHIQAAGQPRNRSKASVPAA